MKNIKSICFLVALAGYGLAHAQINCVEAKESIHKSVNAILCNGESYNYELKGAHHYKGGKSMGIYYMRENPTKEIHFELTNKREIVCPHGQADVKKVRNELIVDIPRRCNTGATPIFRITNHTGGVVCLYFEGHGKDNGYNKCKKILGVK